MLLAKKGGVSQFEFPLPTPKRKFGSQFSITGIDPKRTKPVWPRAPGFKYLRRTAASVGVRQERHHSGMGGLRLPKFLPANHNVPARGCLYKSLANRSNRPTNRPDGIERFRRNVLADSHRVSLQSERRMNKFWRALRSSKTPWILLFWVIFGVAGTVVWNSLRDDHASRRWKNVGERKDEPSLFS